MATAPPVWVVLLNWNGAGDTIDCLTSLECLQYAARHVMVVDNGSTDDSVDRLRARWPDLEILRSERNLGFAAGNNIGIRRVLSSDARYVWLLNNDTTVEPDTLSRMLEEAARDPRTGIVGSLQYWAQDGRLQSWGGGNFNRLTGSAADSTTPGPRDYITAASMLIRREVIDEVGFLDERFFIYWEDADFCRRATKAGWKIAVATGAVVYHKSGAAMNRGVTGRSVRADRAHVQSSGIFLAKHAGFMLPVLAVGRVVGILVNRLIRRQPRRIPVLVADFARGVAVGRGWLDARERHRVFLTK